MANTEEIGEKGVVEKLAQELYQAVHGKCPGM
jgi:hypothetical protein